MRQVAVIGGGPAGLMAAETMADAGLSVTVYDAMPSVGRKFLLAGKSGLNITHSEHLARFLTRFGTANDWLRPALDAFGPAEVIAWVEGLGQETFTGSSGRVFPRVMKASPLLRAWLGALARAGVTIRTRHRLTGIDGRTLHFDTPDGSRTIEADAEVLALGGASWPRLGSDAAWTGWLSATGIEITPFQPANCGFDVAWSAEFAERFAGAPVKSVTATSRSGTLPGEFVITRSGIEGSLVYAHAAALRDSLAVDGRAVLRVNLAPGRSEQAIAAALARQDRKASLATRLRKAAGIDGVKAALLRECAGDRLRGDPAALAAAIASLEITLTAPRPIAEAISSAGGVTQASVDARLMVKARPGLFVAGEMLDWEAPTGGYLLTACLATGRAAGRGVIDWLAET